VIRARRIGAGLVRTSRIRAGERIRGLEPAAAALAAAALVWIVVFSVLVVRRHEGFWDVDFDMGIYDQAVWLLARGQQFMTVRGLPVLGHHASFGLAIFAPASWLGAGPNVWNVIQVIVLALGSVPVYLLARVRRLAPWAAAALGGAFLLHPALQFLGWELLHPETLAITPLLAAWLCATRGSWRWFTFWCLLAVSMKEDVAIALIVLGLVLACMPGRPAGARKAGLLTAGIALGWFVFVAQVLLPAVSGEAAHYQGLYQGVGGSPGGILETLWNDPGNLTGRLVSSETGDFAWRLLAPFGPAGLLAPGALAVGAPQFVLDAISDVVWTRQITFHYVALPLVGATLAMVEGTAFLVRRVPRVPRWVAPAVVLACAGAATLAWGPSPIGAEYRGGWWPPVVDTRIDAKRAAIDAVPEEAAVSAVYTMVPHLSRRTEIYSFPNPWRRSNYGVPGSPTRRPERVDWLVIDRQALDADGLALLDAVLDGRADGAGPFRVVRDRADVLVARRVRG